MTFDQEDSSGEGRIRFQSLLEHLHAGVIVHAPDTSILLANKEASRLLGLTVAQMQGKKAIDPGWCFLREDGTPLPLNEYPVEKAILSGESYEDYIIGIYRPDTRDRVWVLVNAIPEFDDQHLLIQITVTFVDITRQKETQKALEQSEAKFSKVFHFSPGMIIITSTVDGTILEANNKIAETGYSKEELIGHTTFQLNLWGDLSERDLYLEKLYHFGRVENFEAKFRKKSGELIPCMVSGEVIQIHDMDCIINVLIDITDRKQEESEVKILSEIVEGVILTSDLNDLLKLIHQSLKKVLYAENCFFALYNQSNGLFEFPYFVDKYDSAPLPQELSKSCTQYVFRTGHSILITPQIFKDLTDRKEIELVGSSSPSWIGVPLQTSSGVIGVLVLQHYEKENIYTQHQLNFLDSIGNQVASVIERKRTENELEKSYSLIAAALESTADGILVVNNKGKITNFNNKFTELWHIPESVISNRNDEELLAFVQDQLTNPEAFFNKVKSLYNNEGDNSFDVLDFKDGRTFERYSQAQIFKGKSVGRVWSFRDITERRKTIQALYESEARLSELNATKDKFFSIIAHDLKSPFNSIVGFSDMLMNQVRKRDYDGVEEYAGIILQSSQKAMNLLINLIEWSRSQSGRMDFNPEFIEIGTLVHDVFEICNVAAMEKSVLLVMDIPRHITIFLDKDMISSVIRNLLSNAIKFTYPGGRVVIKAKLEGQELVVSISDNGIGIQQQYLNKLFRIDENYSIPGTQNEKGTGLGLVLCKDFVEKHNGKIWAESELGKGSSFYFTIPKY